VKHWTRVVLSVVFLTSGPIAIGQAQRGTSEITAEELKAHVKYLASDDLEGRASGSEGNRKAAEYVAQQFQQYGLKPAGDNSTYMQTFEFVSAVQLGKNNALAFQDMQTGTVTTFAVDSDFRPLGFSSNGSVSGPLVFAGYGITATEKGYDDYKDLDVTGKIVIVLRHGPDGNDMHSEFARYTSLRNKARFARDKGAVGLILITGPADSEDDDLPRLSFDNSFASSGIATIWLRRSHVQSLLGKIGADLASIQVSIKDKRQPNVFEVPEVIATISTDLVHVKSTTANVLGYLSGSNPKQMDHVIVLGAHLDHLGYGGPGSGSLTPDVHAIHNGADDNASGTASLLELAQAFGASSSSLNHTLLFIAFSGEELGTLGSGYYVANPAFQLQQTIAMLNMDMVGRMHERTLTVQGMGTSPIWPDLVNRANSDSSLDLKFIQDGLGPSDQAQFYGKDIPVLFFFTGTHNDYHKPSDDWDRLNYLGQEKVTRLVYRITKELDASVVKPQFVRVQSSMAMGGGETRSFNVTLGVIPDYSDESDGMKVGGIRPGGPAEGAGILAGDLIVRMAGKKVMNIYDYMGILGELKPGQTIDVEVIREGKALTLTATMAKRSN
jgi:aminopeptidase YwaD